MRPAFPVIHVEQGPEGDEDDGKRYLFTLYDSLTHEPLPTPQGLCADTEDHRLATMYGLTSQAQDLGWEVDWNAMVVGTEGEEDEPMG